MKRRDGRKVVVGLAGLSVVVLIGASWPKFVAWYTFHSLFESIGTNEQGCAEYRHRQTGIVMVRVRGSVRGLSRGKSDRVVKPFLIAKNQLKRSEWQRGQTAGSSPLRGEDQIYRGQLASWDQLGDPVEWTDGQIFCERTGLSLPTTVQWVHVYRAPYRLPVPTSFGVEFGALASGLDENGGRLGGPRLTIEWCQDGFAQPPSLVNMAIPPQTAVRPVYVPLP